MDIEEKAVRKLAVPLAVLAAAIAVWVFFNRPIHVASSPSGGTASLGTELPYTGEQVPGTRSEGEKTPTEAPSDDAGVSVGSTAEDTAQNVIYQDPYLTEAQERVFAKCQPSSDFIDIEAFQCALDFEGVDSNWGPLAGR
jgi:hypothetical protein